jgi:hypothetical protein
MERKLVAFGTKIVVEEFTKERQHDGSFQTLDEENTYAKGIARSVGHMVDKAIKEGYTIFYLQGGAERVGHDFSDRLFIVDMEDVGATLGEENGE